MAHISAANFFTVAWRDVFSWSRPKEFLGLKKLRVSARQTCSSEWSRTDVCSKSYKIVVVRMYINLPSVTNNDLRRVLVGHNDRWAWKTTSVG